MLNRIVDSFINFCTRVRIFRARYIREGRCKQCGNCCRSIKLLYDGELIRTEEMFEEGKKVNPDFKMLYINGTHEGGHLKFSCKYLGDDNKCKRYFFRPKKCWTYPDHEYDHVMQGKQTKEGCGFTYKSTVSFEEVMEFVKEEE